MPIPPISVPDVFVGYKTEDRPIARLLAEKLEAEGFSTWWDDKDIKPGRYWDDAISTAVETSSCVVILWSAGARESEFVRAEAHVGKRRGNLVPARIDSSPPPYPFEMLQTLSLDGWKGEAHHEGYRRLLRRVRELVAEDRARGGRMHADPTSEVGPDTDTARRVLGAASLAVTKDVDSGGAWMADFELAPNVAARLDRWVPGTADRIAEICRRTKENNNLITSGLENAFLEQKSDLPLPIKALAVQTALMEVENNVLSRRLDESKLYGELDEVNSAIREINRKIDTYNGTKRRMWDVSIDGLGQQLIDLRAGDRKLHERQRALLNHYGEEAQLRPEYQANEESLRQADLENKRVMQERDEIVCNPPTREPEHPEVDLSEVGLPEKSTTQLMGEMNRAQESYLGRMNELTEALKPIQDMAMAIIQNIKTDD